MKTMVFALGLVLGAGSMHLWHSRGVGSDWYDLQTERTGYSHKSEALFGVDIPLPKIEAVSGQAKLIQRDDRGSFEIGYRVKVPVASLDPEQIPPKYKGEIAHSDGWQLRGTEQVTYVASFTFRLKDEDGFLLQEATSGDHWIRSNSDNTIQDVVAAEVTASTATRVRAVQVHLTVKRCETCRGNE